MPFTIPEALADIPQLLSLVTKIQTSIAAMPPAASRKTTDYSNLLCSLLPDVAALVDEIEAQSKS